jgi:hypothetical protein
MKNTIFVFCFFCFVFCFFCATAAFGQAGASLSSVISPPTTPDHPLHASQHAMGEQSSLLGNSCCTSAQGEQPLWEFGSSKVEIPLGDIARALRKEKERSSTSASKALKVSEN